MDEIVKIIAILVFLGIIVLGVYSFGFRNGSRNGVNCVAIMIEEEKEWSGTTAVQDDMDCIAGSCLIFNADSVVARAVECAYDKYW